MSFLTLSGGRTYWTHSGTGSRAALFIHCGLAHLGIWRGVQKPLMGDLSMFAFDLPGHGQSSDWNGQGDVQTIACSVAEALLAQECQRPVDLIGHSFGGTVALRLAQTRPDWVRSLILIEPALFAAAEGHPDHARVIGAMKGPFADAMARADHATAAAIFQDLWGGGPALSDLPAMFRDDIISRIQLVDDARPVTDDDINGQLAPGALEALDIPVLLIEGQDSPPIIAALHDTMERRIADVTRVVIEGHGHMVPATAPAHVADAIKAFLQANPA